ncbi:hypothetical protein Tco_1416586 [Tanacetum coccineum]
MNSRVGGSGSGVGQDRSEIINKKHVIKILLGKTIQPPLLVFNKEKYGEDDEEHSGCDYLTRMGVINEVKHENEEKRFQE